MVFARFLPHEGRFFDYFEQDVENAAQVAQALCDLLDNYSDVERKVKHVQELEHRGDDITHRIFKALYSTFVTPLDREDIADLASRLDDFVDSLEAHLIDQQAQVIASTVPMLEKRRDWDKLLQCSIDINRLEGEVDDILDQALASQFDGVNAIPDLIKAIHWGEIYQQLEEAADRAEDIADTLERIVVKNA